MRKQSMAALAVCIATVALAPQAQAANGPMSFEPIDGSAYAEATASWTVPLLAPDNCTQTLVKDETALDVYPGVDDLTDMNVTNETGQHAGRYLYRTHEVGSNGAVTVVDLKTGEATIIAQDPSYARLDGLTWTPWGTVLFAEERVGGRLFEITLDPKDPTVAVSVDVRPELGIMRHEGIGVAGDGAVYVIDEFNGGAIYRFVPTTRGDLSDGQLYALKLNDLTDAQQAWDPATYSAKVGAFTWVPLDMATVVVDAKAAADAANATEFGRPEDVQIIGNTLYVANTSEDRVVAINLSTNVLSSYVSAGVNVPVENEAAGVTGLNSPDNLAVSRDGRLWIVEDNTPSDIWVAGRDAGNDGVADSVELFASALDPGAEISGIYFGKDPHTLFFNIQHPDKPQADGTWTITCK